MKLKGEDIDCGLREWVKSDIKESPRQVYDLGKFFFSVSAATIGALAAIAKFDSAPAFDCPLIASFIVLFVSILFALCMVLPRRQPIAAETDLYDEHVKIARNTERISFAWFAIWLIGTVLGGYAVST